MTTSSDASFWDRAARKYAATPVGDQQAYLRTLNATRDLLKQNDRVLELGCGTGSTALSLAPSVGQFLATDLSAEMISIARRKQAGQPVAGLEFRTATARQLLQEHLQVEAVLGFNYLHLVRDLQGTLRCAREMLVENGLLISKTPCLGEMNPLIRWVLIPVMRAVGKAPFAGAFTTSGLCEALDATGFNILSVENHASNGDDSRPFIVARRR